MEAGSGTGAALKTLVTKSPFRAVLPCWTAQGVTLWSIVIDPCVGCAAPAALLSLPISIEELASAVR